MLCIYSLCLYFFTKGIWKKAACKMLFPAIYRGSDKVRTCQYILGLHYAKIRGFPCFWFLKIERPGKTRAACTFKHISEKRYCFNKSKFKQHRITQSAKSSILHLKKNTQKTKRNDFLIKNKHFICFRYTNVFSVDGNNFDRNNLDKNKFDINNFDKNKKTKITSLGINYEQIRDPLVRLGH